MKFPIEIVHVLLLVNRQKMNSFYTFDSSAKVQTFHSSSLSIISRFI